MPMCFSKKFFCCIAHGVFLRKTLLKEGYKDEALWGSGFWTRASIYRRIRIRSSVVIDGDIFNSSNQDIIFLQKRDSFCFKS
jgi:hypothetical protein